MVRKAKEESLLLGFFGNGEVAPEEVEAQLDDFLKGQPEDVTFVLPVTKVHFNDTLQAIIEYANGDGSDDNPPIPYEVVTDEVSAKARALSKYLKGAEKVHQVARIGQKVISRLSQVDNGILTVMWDDDDDELQAVCNGAMEKEIEVFDLTSGMGKVEFEDDGEDEKSENEPDDEPKPKSATKAAKDDEEPEPDGGEGEGDDDEFEPYTSDELEKADLDTLKKIAGDYEIDVPPRTRATTLRTLILEHQEREEKRAAKAKEALAGVKVEAEVDYGMIKDIVEDRVDAALNAALEPDGLLDTAFGEIVEAIEEVNKTLLTLVEAIESGGAEANVVPPKDDEEEPEPEEKPASTTKRRRRI